jgi:hypothetical protein
LNRFLLPLAGGAAALLLSACAYDYIQRTDRVGYSHGDAVKANIAAQTINPSSDAAYKVKGLGKSGAARLPEAEDAADQ